jgi:hypothetical protein
MRLLYEALGQIDAWLETASAVLLAEGETYWPRLRDREPADLTRFGQRLTR